MTAKAKDLIDRHNKGSAASTSKSSPTNVDADDMNVSICFVCFSEYDNCDRLLIANEMVSCFQDDRRQRLQEHARRLIAMTRARSQHNDSPTSPTRKLMSDKTSCIIEKSVDTISLEPSSIVIPDATNDASVEDVHRNSPLTGTQNEIVQTTLEQQISQLRPSPLREHKVSSNRM